MKKQSTRQNFEQSEEESKALVDRFRLSGFLIGLIAQSISLCAVTLIREHLKTEVKYESKIDAMTHTAVWALIYVSLLVGPIAWTLPMAICVTNLGRLLNSQ